MAASVESVLAKPDDCPVRAALGDAGILETLRTSTVNLLRKYFQQFSPMMRDQETVDILDEMKLRALKGSFDPRAGSSVSAWLFGIVRKIICERLRNAKSNPITYSMEEIGPSPESILDEQFANPEMLERLKPCVQRLAPLQSELIEMRYYRGMSSADIARLRNENHSTVRQRLRRALHELAAMLEPLAREGQS